MKLQVCKYLCFELFHSSADANCRFLSKRNLHGLFGLMSYNLTPRVSSQFCMKTGRFALLLSGLKLSLGKLFIGFLCLIIEKHYICHFFVETMYK